MRRDRTPFKPRREARVNTRWWWYGGAVEEREVRRQLEAMRDVGIGGVEIQFLYPLDFDDPSAGQMHADFFSPEFFNILDFTLSCAKELDIDVDLTLGSGCRSAARSLRTPWRRTSWCR